MMIGCVVSIGITIGLIGLVHQSSGAYSRVKELERECKYITPDSGKEIGYRMENGSIVSVEHLDGGLFGRDSLEIKLDNVSFRSKGISPKDAKVLQTLFIKNDEKQECFRRENINNYGSWQEEYEELIDEIAERRAKFEENTLYKIKYE